MRFFHLLLLITIFQATCRPINTNTNGEPAQPTATTETAEVPTTADLPSTVLPAGWTRMEPGGETRCAHDTPFAFWVRPGDPEKLLLYFQGGGGCWDYNSCAPGSTFYDQAVDVGDDPQFKGGIFNLENPENPFREHTIVYVPSCNGDVYWGDNVQKYVDEAGQEITVYHRGFVNGSAALAWASNYVTDPEEVFVTGCSAGSMGSLMFTPYVVEQYPQARVGQLGDSLAFIFGGPVNVELNWGAAKNIPEWIPALDALDPEELLSGDYYAALANHYPEVTFSQYNTQADNVQIRFYQAAGGGAGLGFTEELTQTLSSIHARADNFRSFTAEGNLHCILPRDEFYQGETAGVRLVEWVAGLVAGREVENVQCDTCAVDFGP